MRFEILEGVITEWPSVEFGVYGGYFDNMIFMIGCFVNTY
jgi:hypothetical protein